MAVVQIFFHEILQLLIVHDFLALKLGIFSSDACFAMSLLGVVFSVDFVFVAFIPNRVTAAAERVSNVRVRNLFLSQQINFIALAVGKVRELFFDFS